MNRLGVVVSGSCVRAVVTDGERPVWAGSRSVTGSGDIRHALGELAGSGMPVVRGARVSLTADLCQLKVLRDLPVLRRSRLRQAVALQAGRWFLRNGRQLVTDVIRVEADGTVLAAAAEEDTVRGIAQGMAEAGIGLISLAPLAVILEDGRHEVGAGRLRQTIEVENGTVRTLRREPRGPDPDTAVDEQRALEHAAWTAARRPVLDLVPSDVRAARARRLVRWGMRGAVAGLALWLVAGGVLLQRLNSVENGTHAELRALAPALAPALALRDDLTRTSEALALLDGAREARSRDVRLLAALTEALSDSTWVVSLRRAPAGDVTLVGFTPSATRLITRLADVSGIVAPALDGPVTREQSARGVRERAAIRFRWNPVVRP